MGGVRFEALEEPPRLRVADTVGNEQFTLFLDSPVEPEPVSAEGFTYPVTDAVQVEISACELEGAPQIHLWDTDGQLLHVLNFDDEFRAPPDEYFLELCRPVKTYLRVTGSVTARNRADRTCIQIDTDSSVDIGARSPRRQPADTITTTEAPPDIMSALSQLGDGLLTTSPARAYPNLRGYPPEIQLGPELHVPDELEAASRPVTLAVPADLGYLFEAAPLVYYLDADVREASQPRVCVDGESIYEFDPASFADEVGTLLRHVFVLDCVVRTAGSYPIESVECGRLVDEIVYDLGDLYQADLGERLRMYLDVPFGPVAREGPEWPATAHVEPVVENVESIPHVVAQLVPIRSASPERISGDEARRAALTAFTDSGNETRAASEVFDGDASFVDVCSGGETTDVWVGSDVPITANKFVVEGFRNRFGRTASDEDSIDVTVVCNEPWMSDEASTVRDRYRQRQELPFEVTFYENLDRDSTASLLQTETDFLHYIGHATSEGLECSDGFLDVSTVPSVGIETYFLNACQSYRQATELVERGAIGGIATLSDVTDEEANKVGSTLAKLLNLGFPLRVGLAVASTRSVVGGQYLALGDDGVTLAPTQSVPYRCSVEETDGGFVLTISTFSTRPVGLGSMYIPGIGDGSDRYLAGKSIGPFELTAPELQAFLRQENMPVDFDGEFRWAFDLAEELD